MKILAASYGLLDTTYVGELGTVLFSGKGYFSILDLDCFPKAHVSKAWSSAWCYFQ
jgi:hypothetical protein